MGAGGVCHECGKRNCECDYDPIQAERDEFVATILRACRKSGVTVEYIPGSDGTAGEPCFMSAPLDDAGFGFVVDLSEIEEKLRKQRK